MTNINEYIQLVLEEYKTLRSEILDKEELIINIYNYHLAFIGVISAGSIASKNPEFIYFSCTFFIPFIAIIGLMYCVYEDVNIKRIGRYIAELEHDMNRVYNNKNKEDVMFFWEIVRRIPDKETRNALKDKDLESYIPNLKLYDDSKLLFDEYKKLKQRGKYVFLKDFIKNHKKSRIFDILYKRDLIRLFFGCIALSSELIAILIGIYLALDLDFGNSFIHRFFKLIFFTIDIHNSNSKNPVMTFDVHALSNVVIIIIPLIGFLVVGILLKSIKKYVDLNNTVFMNMYLEEQPQQEP